MKDGIIRHALAISAVAMVVYHLIFARYVLQSPIGHQNTHLGFSLIVLFLAELRAKRERRLVYIMLLLLSVIATGYVQANVEELDARCMLNTKLDLVIGGLLMIAVFVATWVAFGPALPIITSIFVLYTYAGYHLPPPFRTMVIPLDEMIIKLSIGLTGMYGVILSVSANFIFLFMVFAALISATGAVDFFAQIGKFVGRYFKAGPAMAAVITSGLMGSVSGSAGANVMITGSFTIPAMKQVGYRPEQAGGIEAAASTGGPIIPPVMGVAAFIMCGITNIPYSKIIGVAVIPAVLYVLCCGAYAEFQARRLGVAQLRDPVDVRIILNRLPLFVGSFVTIITLFLLGYSPMFVGFSVCVAIFLLSLLRKETRLSLTGLIEALTEGAITGARVGISCALLGLVVSAIVMCGLGIKLPMFIGDVFGHNLPLLLVMTGIVSIILGCGLPASASYLLVVIVIAPVLIKMGVALLPAHFFAFFFANFSFITPPVAIAALFGAQLAGASYIKTGFEAAKVGIAGFILPFIIVFCPAVMLDFSKPLTSALMLLAIITALIILQTGITGYYFRDLSVVERSVSVGTSLILLSYILTSDIVLFLLGIALAVMLTLRQLTQRRKVKHAASSKVL